MEAYKGPKQIRKSHTKSRNGCAVCKRRHIRCDENFPQCRNCTKHGVECEHSQKTAQSSARHSGHKASREADSPSAHSTSSSTSSPQPQEYWNDVSAQSYDGRSQTSSADLTLEHFNTSDFPPPAHAGQGFWELNNTAYLPYSQSHTMGLEWQVPQPWSFDMQSQVILPSNAEFNALQPMPNRAEAQMAYVYEGSAFPYGNQWLHPAW